MAATGKVIGTVTAVVGEAKATAADGTVRILQVGDKVYSDEAISTSEAGSINVALEGGKTLACDGGVDLALHESILNVASSTASSEVDAIQRAIAAGQDPSQVAAATAAGGAPAAGGNDLDGGSHDPVILEQSNSASVVSSGFDTEGASFTYATPQTESLQVAAVVNSATTLSSLNAEPAGSAAPVHPVFDSPLQGNAPAEEPAVVTVSVSAPAQVELPAVVEPAFVTASASTPAQQNAPAVVETPASETPAAATFPETTPAIVVADTSANDQPAEAPQPQVTLEQPAPEQVASNDLPPVDVPVVIPTDTNQQEQPIETAQPPVVTDSTNDSPVEIVTADPSTDENIPSEPVLTTEDTPPSNDAPVVVVVETGGEEQGVQPPADTGETEEVVVVPTVDTSTPSSGTLSYSISANTNQDEQLALLTFEDTQNHIVHQSLVFFGQEGQQKPSAVPVLLDAAYEGTVKLTYLGAFAGNSDDSTGHTAQKIAIKDFALGETGTEIQLADQSDGVNIGIGSKSVNMEASVEIQNGTAGDWSFANPATDTNDRYTYEGNPVDGGAGFDILDVSGDLDLGGVVDSHLENLEVISLKGSGAQELTLSAADVLNVTDGANVLHIVGGKEDTLNLDSSWTVKDGDSNSAGTQPTYFGWVQVVHNDSGATLLVDPDVNIKGALMG